MGKLTFKGGIHPYEGKKLAKNHPIEKYLPKGDMAYLMSQHIGAPSVPCVKKGDQVLAGQKIADAGGFVSVPLHASVSGTVKGIEKRLNATGAMIDAIIVENDQQYQEVEFTPAKLEDLTKEEILNRIKEGGVVGMGGAGFPTHVKLAPKDPSKIEYVLVNGAECEPYLTADHRLMLEKPAEIIDGIHLMMLALDVKEAHVGVENNKMDAVEALRAAAKNVEGITIHDLPVRYPQGGEKQLCQAITGKQVPPGGLPANIGCAVFNINTTIAIYHAIKDGMPVVRKVVTVSGSGVVEPKNLECPIGTPVSLLFDACGGLKDETFKLIAGGPMMGMAQASADFPVAKGTGAVLAFAANENKVSEDPTCIRCGRCVEACPMHLEPLYLYLYVQKNRIEDLEAAHVMDCIECGACSYICPGRLHLTHSFKVGKQKVKEAAAKAKAAAEAAKAAEEAKKEA